MKIALLGFGTVGRGAYEVSAYTDDIEVGKVVEIRDVPELGDLRTENFEEVLNDPSIDLVAECIGGKTLAKDFIVAAMRAGKHVVTPNKALMSECYDELMDIAEENGVEIRFTPAAGGGIPWLYNLHRTKRCDKITEVHGIVNGTSNFILDNMHKNGSDFGEVLKEAQSLGYAEKNPAADIEGLDTLRKCVLSSNIAFDCRIKEAEIPTFGIDSITADDVDYFNECGLTCKLLMNAGLHEGGLYAYVEPVLFGPGHLEAAVGTNFNLITLNADNAGTLSFYGQGAGKLPTGSSVIQDALDIQYKIRFDNESEINNYVVDNSILEQQYYMRVAGGIEGLPAEIIESSFDKDGSAFIITNPITVKCAHEIAAGFKAAGRGFFMASIRK